MREAAKVLAVVVFMFATPTAAVVWTDDQPSTAVMVLRYLCPVLAVLGIGTFLKIHFRADEVPDYLGRLNRKYFNRGGFCFALQPVVEDGTCYLQTHFQNQYDGTCTGRIALRPARGFFLGRADIEAILVEIHCEPATFGVNRIPIGVPLAVQGKKQSFEVGASVAYPNGKGCRVRFGDGLVIRANSNFGNAFGTALTVAGAMTGQIVLSQPATITMVLPRGVVEHAPNGSPQKSQTIWRIGDPPLDPSFNSAARETA
jgi:hypothetical protein